MDITWEDTGSQCVDSRPNGQKTEQKKVTLFATYSMLIIRNRRKKVCTKCEILLIIAYLEKKNAVTELEVLSCGYLVDLK